MGFPFTSKHFTFTQPDGSKINIIGSGNQFHAVFETTDGFTVVKNPNSGFL